MSDTPSLGLTGRPDKTAGPLGLAVSCPHAAQPCPPCVPVTPMPADTGSSPRPGIAPALENILGSRPHAPWGGLCQRQVPNKGMNENGDFRGRGRAAPSGGLGCISKEAPQKPLNEQGREGQGQQAGGAKARRQAYPGHAGAHRDAQGGRLQVEGVDSAAGPGGLQPSEGRAPLLWAPSHLLRGAETGSGGPGPGWPLERQQRQGCRIHSARPCQAQGDSQENRSRGGRANLTGPALPATPGPLGPWREAITAKFRWEPA